MIHEHPLSGCTPTPLASYLKALAVLRLIAETGKEGGGDPDATGFWRNDVFVLRTRLTKDELRAFFLERYRPTPLLSPWNGRAGFLEGEGENDDDNEGESPSVNDEDDEDESTRIGAEMVRAFTHATLHARFEPIKKAIEGFQRVHILNSLNVSRAKAKALEAEIKKNKKTKRPVSDDEDRLKKLKAENKWLKAQVLLQLRNEADEAWLPWFDACQSLAQVSSTKEQDRNKPLHAPLLGKGGVDGSMDFGVNFQKRVTQLFDLNTGKPLSSCIAWLDHALFDSPTASLIAVKPGQFNPGAGKFPNSGNGFLGEELGNPWNSLLSLEGTMLFATATSRRLESGGSGMLSAPFTVTSQVSGAGNANLRDESEKLTNGEIWMPLWNRPTSYDELHCLLTEGRAAVNGRTARDGLDFSRAVAQLGVDRGIRSFQRFGFLKRFGKTYLAAPLARLPVRRNEDADLIGDLEKRGWLRSVQQYARGKLAPDSFRSAVHQLDTALFALTQQASRTAVQTVLRRVGQIEAAVSSSTKTRKEIPPVPQLSSKWVTKYDDPSAEYRIATAVAGLRLNGKKHIEGRVQSFAFITRHHMVAVNELCNDWEKESRIAVWGPGPLTGNLVALLHRRRLEAIALGEEGEVLASQTGATRDDVAAFLDNTTDDSRIGELLGGLACVDWSNAEPPRADKRIDEETVLPPEFALLKVLFTPESMLRALKWLPPDRSFRLLAEIPARLAANDTEGAVRIAWQRLRVLGVKLPGRMPPQVSGVIGARWLAALCIPLTYAETARLLRALGLNPESESAATQPAELNA